MPINTKELHDAGYVECGPTSGFILVGISDTAVCELSVCSRCGKRGLEYHPFVKKEEHGYRAFSLCPKCGYSEEF